MGVGLYVFEIGVHVGSIVERDSVAQDIAWGHVGDWEAILREVDGRHEEIESGLEFGVKQIQLLVQHTSKCPSYHELE